MQLPEPMLAKPVKRLLTGAHWWMEAKYDGWRALAGVLDRVGLWTRAGNAISQVPYITDALLEQFPAGTILDGEIVDLRTGRQWNRTESTLAKTRGGYQHKPTAEDPPLTYVLFDVLTVAGTMCGACRCQSGARSLRSCAPASTSATTCRSCSYTPTSRPTRH